MTKATNDYGSTSLRLYARGILHDLRLTKDSILELWKNDKLFSSFIQKKTVDEITYSLENRIINLENNESIYQIFQYTSTNKTGVVAIPTEATIFDLYQDSITDCICVYSDENQKPIEEAARDSNGELISITSFDTFGNFNLSNNPSKNACLIYFVKIQDKFKSNIDQSKILSSFDYNDVTQSLVSVGIIDLTIPEFVNNGNGSITIEHTHVGLRSDPNHTGNILPYYVNEATINLIDNIEQYLLVRNNNGIAEYYLETNRANINNSNNVAVYVFWRQGLNIHSVDQDSIGLGLSNKIASMIFRTETYKRSIDGGLIILESTTPNSRTIIVSNAIVYRGIVPQIVDAFNSSTDKLTLEYSSGTSKLYQKDLVYNNTQYDNGTALVQIPNNKFATRWYYRSVGDDKEVFYVLGIGYYNSAAEAELEKERGDLSFLVKNHCILVGRSIIQYNATNGITDSSFTTTFAGSTVINHNDTNNKQGGIIDEYYHLSNKQYTEKIVNQQFGDVPNLNYTVFEPNGFYKGEGTNVYWRDIDFPIVIRNTGTNIPQQTPIQGNITCAQWAVNDYYNCDPQELVHEWKEGTQLYWHIHMYNNGVDTTDRFVKWEIEYTWCNINTALPVTTTISYEYTIPANTPTKTMHLISIGNFTPTGGKIGGHVLARIRRIASTGLAPSSNPWCGMLQLHVACDTLGSRNIGTK